jgi:dihydroxyacetone kinase-like predicted kinase
MAPSTSDFIDAFRATSSPKIIVFPNNSNIKMTALQARALYAMGDEEIENSIVVIDSRSVADCYAALAIIDFSEEDIDSVCADITSTIKNIYTVKITPAVKDAVIGEISVRKNDFIAMHGMELLASSPDKAELAISLIKGILDEEERDTLTLFVGAYTDDETIDEILNFVKNEYIYTETDLVRTDDPSANVFLSFE